MHFDFWAQASPKDSETSFHMLRRKDRAKPSVECPVNRSLLGLWWLLEAIPRRQWWYTSDGGRMAWFWPHVARRRVIPKNALVHESVVRKLEVDQGYKPSNLPDEYVVEA